MDLVLSKSFDILGCVTKTPVNWALRIGTKIQQTFHAVNEILISHENISAAPENVNMPFNVAIPDKTVITM